MAILIVGGAGYIGSHMVTSLADSGNHIIVLDNLSTGYADAVLEGEFIQGDISDRALLDKIFTSFEIDCVMHFASYIQVGESVSQPAKYYHNNVVTTVSLLDAMIQHDVNNFIFSSTAAIYGIPEYVPIDEKHLSAPVNPYGKTKLMVEHMLDDYAHAYNLNFVSLRYFNAAGAHPDGILGERHEPETHLIPLILQVASGRRENIRIFGTDYTTPDGTCIRDYIHVMDICDAHILAYEWLKENNHSGKFNLGNGNGYSVRDVITTAKLVTGKSLNLIEDERRIGDPAILVANSKLAKEQLGWKPTYDLETIIQHAWQWELRHFCA